MKKPRLHRQYFFDLKPAQSYAKKLRKDGWPLANVGPILISSAYQYVVDPHGFSSDFPGMSIDAPKKKPKVDEWFCGYAAALSNIIRTYDETSLAKNAMVSDGLTLAMFKRAGVEKYDLDALKKAR